ncbi:MAG: beta-lactamase family protein [Jiangellaceae bacterium]|nr:beta-lactamase family protein [Jiangellaceae bacterium]
MSLDTAQRAADHVMPRWITRNRAVGVVVGLCKAGETAVKPYGSSGITRPLGPDTVMEIGSVSKTFTGVLLADMTLRGEVNLDDPISRFVPFAVPVGAAREMTLLDLATHTARLPRSGRTLVRQFLRDRQQPFAAFTERDLYASVAAARPKPGLGTRVAYSNLGFGLLGNILGRAAGRPYEELVVERVCRPLGLAETTAGLPSPDDPRVAVGHRTGARPVAPLRIPTLGGAGALRSTANDMVRYVCALLHPERTDVRDMLCMAVGPHRPVARQKAAVGLGWFHLHRGDRVVVWHNGGTVGFGSFVAFDPRRDAAVVLLSNSRYLLRSGRTALRLLDELAG